MPRLDRLRVLADALEVALAEAPVGVKAQLAAQYRATLAELDALDADAGVGDPIDEIAKRRAARRASSA